jgi:hypothetical protein
MRPLISKQNTKYKKTILRNSSSCPIYKLAQVANVLICNKLFAIGHFTVGLVLYEMVMAIVLLKKLISWPMGDRIQFVMIGFKSLCGMSNVMGAIDGTHICITKPIGFLKDYYYHKTGGYSMVAQVVVGN